MQPKRTAAGLLVEIRTWLGDAAADHVVDVVERVMLNDFDGAMKELNATLARLIRAQREADGGAPAVG